MMIVATAGSTDTGTVDDLTAVAALAREHRVWLHVDGAYGAGYVLTGRGRAHLTGIEQADSITFDPHKAWSLPYGTSVLLVRDAATLRRAFSTTGHYMPAAALDPETPDFTSLGVELTREYRALRLWLPLYVHGTDAVTVHLDEKLTMAQLAYHELRQDPAFDLPWAPDLGVVAFRLRHGDAGDHVRMVELLQQRAISLSPPTIRGRAALRMCICSHRTHAEHVRIALDAIRDVAREIHGTTLKAA
jgi:aromatic-L-amino-acid decarboxylase